MLGRDERAQVADDKPADIDETGETGPWIAHDQLSGLKRHGRWQEIILVGHGTSITAGSRRLREVAHCGLVAGCGGGAHVIVGRVADQGESREAARALKLEERIKWLGQRVRARAGSG